MYSTDFYNNFKNEFMYLKDENELLPNELTCEIPDSFEYSTIINRIPNTILKRIIDDNLDYINENNLNDELKKLKNLFTNGNINKHELFKSSNEKYWNVLLSYFLKNNKKITNSCFLFNEFYFYKYLCNIFDYEKKKFDFFEKEKNKGINYNKEIIEQISILINNLIDEYKKKPNKKIFCIFFYLALWSNQYDLSLNPADLNDNEINDKKKHYLKQKKLNLEINDIDALYNGFYIDKIVCNDIDEIYSQFTNKKHKRFIIVLDNMGVELITDLALLTFLSLFFDEIVIHTKKYPLYVSDTMIKDIHNTINNLCIDTKYTNTFKIANYWNEMINKKKWIIKDDIYWNIPLPYWIMSNNIFNEFKESNFVCFKGDMNYRRCLGDLKFDCLISHKKILNYFPTSTIFLRCIKCSVICGLDKNIVNDLNEKDKNWCFSGEYALLQYV